MQHSQNNKNTSDTNVNPTEKENPIPNSSHRTAQPHKLNAANDLLRPNVYTEIPKQVIRAKLSKLRHLILKQAFSPSYLESIFPLILKHFEPQEVTYNGGIANVPRWKISCYLEVMPGGIPCTQPNVILRDVCWDLLECCNDLFRFWYHQQYSCNTKKVGKELEVKRLMTFITRYTPNPGEEALLKHIDGAGKVDGSVVVSLPIDRWSAPEDINAYEGGGLTFWDGGGREIFYDTRCGDVALIDRAVWHQANPITRGTRWALVIFYKVL